MEAHGAHPEESQGEEIPEALPLRGEDNSQAQDFLAIAAAAGDVLLSQCPVTSNNRFNLVAPPNGNSCNSRSSENNAAASSNASVTIPIELATRTQQNEKGASSTLRGRGQKRRTTTRCPPEFEHYFKGTILHMDQRRLQRQLSGVRKKDPQKRVIFITLFCLCLLAWNTAFLDRETEWWKFGFVVRFCGLKEELAIAAVKMHHQHLQAGLASYRHTGVP